MDVPMDRRVLVALLLVLTGVTGLIDAVSYLRLGHVFVANMTGNVVFLGFTLQPGSGLSPAASVIAIAGFLAGAVLGGRLATLLGDRPRHWLTTAFTVQAGLLAGTAALAGLGVLTYHGSRALIMTVLLAAGFGLQNATVRHLAARDLTTTVLTLALTGLAADSPLAGAHGQKPLRRLGSVLAMLAGAAAGALLLRVTISGVLVLAAALVALVALGFAVLNRPVWTSADSRQGQ
jgi:uncharacterized membrane protein YoaK (UPF0700 family)